MKTSWFTFGQAHVHSVNGKTFDKDVVVEITSEDPRKKMMELFDIKWSIQYNSLEEVNLEYFPKGIIKIS